MEDYNVINEEYIVNKVYYSAFYSYDELSARYFLLLNVHTIIQYIKFVATRLLVELEYKKQKYQF